MSRMLTRRSLLLGGATVAGAAALAACGGSGAGGGANQDTSSMKPEDIRIGVAMPTKSSERWIKDGDNVKAQLKKIGYQVDLQFAEDDIPTQANQIDNMITQGVNLLIIAPIDGTALSGQLDAAGEAKIPVISYDRLIRDNENVSYYTSFDNYDVGTQMGTSLLTGMGILDASGAQTGAAGPFNIELFGGSPDDNNAPFFFNGAMDVIQPFIDQGVLVVKSGQTDFNTVATMRWDAATAQSRMDNLITSAYSDGSVLHGVLCPLDSLGEQIAALDPLTGADGGAEALPLEFDGVQTDVHQQFDAVIGLDAVGVAGVHHRHERACRRRHHAKGAVALGGDSHTVAQGAGGEDGVGDPLQWVITDYADKPIR